MIIPRSLTHQGGVSSGVTLRNRDCSKLMPYTARILVLEHPPHGAELLVILSRLRVATAIVRLGWTGVNGRAAATAVRLDRLSMP